MDIRCIFTYDSCEDNVENIFSKNLQFQRKNLTLGLTTAKVKFEPQYETDTILKGQSTSYISTKQQCITFMEEYADKSLEELRIEDYAANLKGPQDDDLSKIPRDQPSSSTVISPHVTGFCFSQHVYNISSTMDASESVLAKFKFGAQPQTQTTNLFTFGQQDNSTSANVSLNDCNMAGSSVSHAFNLPLNVVAKKVYTCQVEGKIIPENQELNFIGQYEQGKTNNDVTFVKFANCTVTKVPQGLTKTFPNLKVLWITNSKLKNICNKSMAEYKYLEAFHFNNNEIEFLPGDLFEGFGNLEKIAFCGNKLRVIEPSILNGLDKLKLVDFRENQNYGKFYSCHSSQSFKTSLKDIEHELFNKYPKKFELFKDLTSSRKYLIKENQELKNFKIKLESELEEEKRKNSELSKKNQIGFYHEVKTFIQDETTKDFKIIIDSQEFPVHKILLAARSPTMAELLKNNPEIENLNFVDISVEIFEKILKFLYTDELPGDDATNFLHLFAAAGKLKIKELKNYAAEMLIGQINKINIIEVFKLSNNYEHAELRQKAFDELKKFYPNYKFKDEWITKPEIVLKAIEQFKKNEEAIRKLEEEFENANI